MANETLSAALEREHREIDTGIAEFVSGLESGEMRAEAFARAIAALRRHIYLEEASLFPPMRKGGMMAPLFVMVREHGEMWHHMDELTGQIASGAEPTAIRERCRQLIDALNAHNFKEEHIIYPEADGSLSDEATGELHEFLATGTMPEGWVSQGAAGA